MNTGWCISASLALLGSLGVIGCGSSHESPDHGSHEADHDDHAGHDHEHGSEEESQSVDWSALTGEKPETGVTAAPTEPIWQLLPAALEQFSLQYQVRPLSPQDIESAHAALGPEEAQECARLVTSCHTQFGVGAQGGQLAVLGLYAFATPGDADRFLELVQKGNQIKDAQRQQGGEVQISQSEQLGVPAELGKGLDYRKVVSLPGSEVPVRSLFVVQDRHLVEVTLSNLTLEDATLHALVSDIFATRRSP